MMVDERKENQGGDKRGGYELAERSAAGRFDSLVAVEVGETNVPKYVRPLLNLIQDGKINPSIVITHWLALTDAA